MIARSLMMKRKGWFVCALLVALMACGFANAAEQNPLVGTLELTPAYLTSPGTVNVSITLSNTTDEDFKDPVTLYDPAAQIVTSFGADGKAYLKAGESMTWTGAYDVNQRTLDNGSVVYFATYTIYRESGEAVEQNTPIRAKISQQSAAEAAMDVKRTISPTVAREGQKIKVDYHITNAGSASMSNISITENKDIHGKTQTIPELKAGQTADISYPVTMGKKDLTSGATITYSTEGSDEEQTYVVEDQVIAYGTSYLTAKLTASSKGVVKDGLVTLTLELKNEGSVDYSDIRVSDAALGEVFTNQELKAKKTLKLEKEITLTTTTDYQFNVTAIDSTGTESSTATEKLTVTAVNPEDALTMTVVATPDKTEAYGNPATVRFSVVITNDSNVEATKVVVSHGDTELYTFDSIPAGASRTMTRDTALSTSGKFQFTVSARDPLENTMTFKSNEMQIAVYMPTPEPATPTPPPNPTPEPTFNPATIMSIYNPSIGAVPKAIQSVLLPALIVAGVLLVASLALLIIATKRRADQKRASEKAFDHLERAKRRDYITPAEEEESKEAQEQSAKEEPAKKKKAKQPKLTKEEQDAQMANRRIVGQDEDDWELPHIKYAKDAAPEETEEGEALSSAIGQGLYDDDLSDDLSGYAVPGDPDDGESVMYEQSESEPAATGDPFPAYDDEQAEREWAQDDATEEAGYEEDGYTEELNGDYDDLRDQDDPDAAFYDDALDAEREDGETREENGEPDDRYDDFYEQPGELGSDDRQDDGYAADGRENDPSDAPAGGRRRSRQARGAGNGGQGLRP